MSDKHPRDDGHTSSSSDDDSFGPTLSNVTTTKKPKKRRRRLKHLALYLEALPYDRYTSSYGHSATVTALAAQPHSEGTFVTGTADGIVKFWRKSDKFGELDLAKQYKAHDKVLHASFTPDGKQAATLGADNTIKIFEVYTTDMIDILNLKSPARCFCWCGKSGDDLMIAAGQHDGKVTVYRPGAIDDSDLIVGEFAIHNNKPLTVMEFNPEYNCIVSCDEAGMVEYWDPTTGELPRHEGLWTMKSDTDLYDFRKRKTRPLSLTFNPSYSQFAVMASNGAVALFDFASGKKLKEYNESLEAAREMQDAGTAAWHPQQSEFAKRAGIEQDFTRRGSCTVKPSFDASGNILIYPSLLGIKMVNLRSNACELVLGKQEPAMRFTQLVVYQGTPKKKELLTIESAASHNKLIAESLQRDPVIVAAAFKKNKVYVFSRYDGPFGDIQHQRDAANVALDDPNLNPAAERAAAVEEEKKKSSSTKVTLHTSMGDIQLELFPQYAPLACENFLALCKKGYYDTTIFHRVIPNFMIQGGDPNGDGTGGQSVWGSHFKDEIVPQLKHEPFTLSMANAGKNTNGSQFFITTASASWLDGKHTVFGKVVSGQDVVTSIEQLKCDKKDKPLDSPRIINVSLV